MLTKRAPLLAVIGTTVAIGFSACGEDEPARSTDDIAGNSTDRAFVARMIPHHESAVDMAKLAEQRARHAKVKRLAATIISTQAAEIEQMQRFDDRLERAGVEPGELGVGHEDIGEDMSAGELADATEFDREFIDAMIAHHQGAIHMARAQMETGENPELLQLAEAIEGAQSKEIDRMNMWRVGWYGELSPSGGVPTEESDNHGM